MLDRLARKHGARRPRKRRGRGIGSGHGKTCDRGQKGAGARSGRKRRSWIEGGQMPLARRLPKFGFVNRFRRSFQVVNLRDLARFEKGTLVDQGLLAEARLVARPDRPVKILAEGEIATALVLRVDAASEAACEKIEAAGGRVEILAAANGVDLEGQGS